MNRIISFHLWICCFAFTQARYKRWLPDTNFGNPMNWNVKRVPCGNDVVVVPDESPVVFVQLNTTMRELVLPANGELILGTNTRLAFSSSPDDECPDAGGDVEFTAVHPVPWLDPASWCGADTQRGACDNDTVATLDVERVPCTDDDVVFPEKHAYYVDLSQLSAKTRVKSMRILGSALTTSRLSQFLNTMEGKRMFKIGESGVNKTITVTRKACESKAGCACGNDKPQIAEKICRHVKPNCGRARCSGALLPVGGCCRMCGAIFNMTRGQGFELNTFRSLLQSNFFNKEKDVSPITSVMSGGWLQLVLTDTTGNKSIHLANLIAKAIKEDNAKGGHTFVITNFTQTMSLAVQAPSSQTGPLGSGSIVGIVFAVIIFILILVLVAVVFVYRRNGKPLPTLPNLPNLPSLPNMPNLPSMNFLPRLITRRPNSRTGQTSTVHTAAHVDPGFANPMFDAAPYDDDFVMREMEMIGSFKEEQPTFDSSGFQNPLYGKRASAGFSDPSQADEATVSGEAATPTSAAASGGTTTSATPEPATSGILIDYHGDQAKDSTI